MLQKEKPALDLSAAVNRIEEQATEIERKKAEISRLERMVDEYEKKMEQLLGYEGKSDELAQENEALKGLLAAKEKELEGYKSRINKACDVVNKDIDVMETALTTFSNATKQLNHIDEMAKSIQEYKEQIKAAHEKAQTGKMTKKDVIEDLFICFVIGLVLFGLSYAGAKKGGINDVYQKLNDTQYTVNQIWDKVNK